MTGAIRNVFSDEEINQAMAASDGNIRKAAAFLSEMQGKVPVSPQLLRYWVSQMEDQTISDDLDMAKTAQAQRTAQVENNRLRKITRDVLDAERTKEEVLKGIESYCKNIQKEEPVQLSLKPVGGKSMTIEILFSDLQIGKLMSDYNKQVAVRRLLEYSEVVRERITQYVRSGFNVERIKLALIGDIIESDKKHSNSARACDSGTAEQMELSIRYLSSMLIQPLAAMNIPMDVICVTGNHDHDDHGLMMFKPGREQLSWPLYHALRMIHDAKGHDHICWKIPEGAFHVDDIYGFKVLYEHGVGVSASEASMKKRMAERSSQIKQYITMFRMGDKHNICRFNNDSMVVNGAFFGDDREGVEYSGICGYDGYPAQLMFAHVPRKDDTRLPIFDSLAIQLGHIK